MDNLFARLGEATAKFPTEVESVSKSFSSLKSASTALEKAQKDTSNTSESKLNLNIAQTQMTGATKQAEGVAGGAAEAAGGGLSALAGAAGAAGQIAAAVASALQQVLDKMLEFVEALNPATVMVFNQALRDLKATLGTAFTGVIELLTGIIRQVAGIILPLMEQLKPVFDQLVTIMMSTLIPQIKLWVTVIQALLPVLKVLMSLWEMMQGIMQIFIEITRTAAIIIGAVFQALYAALTPVIVVFKLIAGVLQVVAAIVDAFNMVLQAVMDAMMTLINVALQPLNDIIQGMAEVFDILKEAIEIVGIVFTTIVQTIGEAVKAFLQALFGGNTLRETFDNLKKVLIEVIKNFLLFIARLAMFLGQNEFLQRLITNLENRRPEGAAAAAQNVSIRSFEDISREMSTAAANAGPGGTRQALDLGDVVTEMRAILASGNSGLETFLRQQFDRLIQSVINAIPGGRQVRDTANNVQQLGRDIQTIQNPGDVWNAGTGFVGRQWQAFFG